MEININKDQERHLNSLFQSFVNNKSELKKKIEFLHSQMMIDDKATKAFNYFT